MQNANCRKINSSEIDVKLKTWNVLLKINEKRWRYVLKYNYNIIDT